MNITTAQYIVLDGVNNGITATIDGIGLSVTLDPANRHYAALLEWAEEDGNTIAAAD